MFFEDQIFAAVAPARKYGKLKEFAVCATALEWLKDEWTQWFK